MTDMMLFGPNKLLHGSYHSIGVERLVYSSVGRYWNSPTDDMFLGKTMIYNIIINRDQKQSLSESRTDINRYGLEKHMFESLEGPQSVEAVSAVLRKGILRSINKINQGE